MVLPDSANPFFAELGREIEAAAFQAGLSVILCNTENDLRKEQLYVSLLARNRVDGIILVAAGERGEMLRALAKGELPVVTLDRVTNQLTGDCVTADHLRGAELATGHLARLGHKRIGCIAGPAALSSSGQRIDGYRRALEDAGLSLDDDLICHGDFHAESGQAATRSLLDRPRPPTAIFASNDLMAFGVLRAALELGLQVPQDLAVVGYDDIELARYAIPSLTTVVQPKRDMAREALRLLGERLATNRREPQTHLLSVSLHVRESCGGLVSRSDPGQAQARTGEAFRHRTAQEEQHESKEQARK